jgi:hypothetical protein
VIEAIDELDLEPFYAAYRSDGRGAAAPEPKIESRLGVAADFRLRPDRHARAGSERHWARMAAEAAGVEPPQWALQPIPEVTVVGPPIASQA